MRSLSCGQSFRPIAYENINLMNILIALLSVNLLAQVAMLLHRWVMLTEFNRLFHHNTTC